MYHDYSLYKYNEENNLDFHLKICDEIEKYCCSEYEDVSYATIIRALMWPETSDEQALKNASLKPLLISGIVIDIGYIEDDFVIRVVDDGGNNANFNYYDSDALLRLRSNANFDYAITAIEYNPNCARYTIGEKNSIKPGKRVLLALTDLEKDENNDKWMTAYFVDVSENNDTELTYLDEDFNIHTTEDYLRLYKKLSNEKITPLPTTSSKQSSTSSNGCYIATAVYGGYDCPELWTLRRFRDELLSTNYFGQVFIKFYYKISPSLVRCFGKNKIFNVFWRSFLDKLVFKLNKHGIQNTPYEDK